MRLDILVRFLVGGGAVLVSAASTLAQTVTVEMSTIGCDANRWTVLADNIASGAPINITDIDNTWTAIRIRSTLSASPASIGRITLTSSEGRNTPFEVLVTSDYCRVEFPSLQPSNAGTSWSGLTFGENSDALRNNTRLVAAISGDLTGSIACGSVYRLQFGGDILAPVTAHGEDSLTGKSISYLVARKLLNNGSTNTGSITTLVGDVDVMDIDPSREAGELTGPIICADELNRLIVGGPISISASPGISAMGGINAIEALRIVDFTEVRQPVAAQISAGNAHVRRLHCAAFTGSVSAYSLFQVGDSPAFPAPGITIEGDLDGTITFSGGNARTISVLGDMLEGSSILVGGCSASILVDGDATTIEVAGDAIPRNDAASNVEIGSINGTVERIAAWGLFYNSVAGAGISLRGTHIDVIEVGTEPSSGQLVMSAEVHAPSVGSILVHGSAGMRLINLEQFGLVRVAGEWGDQAGPSSIAATSGLIQVRDTFNHAINFASPTTYTGNVIVNAGGGAFYRVGAIGPTSMPTLGFEQTPLSPNPDYEQTYTTFGGGVGALGLESLQSTEVTGYTVHDRNCVPPRDYDDIPTFLNSAFFHLPPAFTGAYENASITITFRAPVRVDSVTATPFIVTRTSGPGASDYSGMMVFDVRRGSAWGTGSAGPPYSRSITFHGEGVIDDYEAVMDEGTYGVRFRRDPNDPGRLLSDATWLAGDKRSVAGLPAGERYDYVFKLLRDCNRNGVWDTTDIIESPWIDWNLDGQIDACYDWCIGDVNCDFALDGFDVETQEFAVGGDMTDYCLPDPDFNRDFALDGFDVQAVETVVGGGPCPH